MRYHSTDASVSEVKELTPEWYCNPTFLKNCNNFEFGSNKEGQVISDAQLPPWANGSAEKFIEIMCYCVILLEKYLMNEKVCETALHFVILLGKCLMNKKAC